MNDWLEGPLDGNWRDGQAQEHISTGQIWRPGDHAPQIHPAPPPNPYGYDTGPQVPVPPPHSNGHLTNGHIGNGHLTNGHIGNGHLINGHLDNGHTGNGRPAVRTGGPGAATPAGADAPRARPAGAAGSPGR
ncbi:hypothetical protein [Streptomyces lydicamycinicus]|uniref:hypothetical protein n=1 Tax=Streptomyces lydicamycinicus TaxID=1546107 RepID=UPI003D807529